MEQAAAHTKKDKLKQNMPAEEEIVFKMFSFQQKVWDPQWPERHKSW